MSIRGVAAAVAALALLAGCGTAGGASRADAGPGGDVVASFYPLQWVATQVAGDRREVTDLTPPGAEPHDLELTPRGVAGLSEAGLVVYLSGFQPAVDEAVAQADPDAVLDTAEAARLDLDAGTEGTEGAVTDPHFWLDPTRLADVADAVADRLAADDPDGASAYAANAAAVRATLTALDAELAAGLAGCESRLLVTSHEAFGYLAERYDLEQVGISGLSPEAEPGPAALAQVTDLVRDRDVGTIYVETLASPDVARTVADETGATTAVLDPVEGITDASAGEDYPAVMRANLAVLREGQRCS